MGGGVCIVVGLTVGSSVMGGTVVESIILTPDPLNPL